MIAQYENEKLDFTREVLQVALQRNLIHTPGIWTQMLISRNTSTHEYDSHLAVETVEHIQNLYTPLLISLYESLNPAYHLTDTDTDTIHTADI
jgi:uncharacterized protein YqjF (DUF2071 family)